jgi:hypothetical protein
VMLDKATVMLDQAALGACEGVAPGACAGNMLGAIETNALGAYTSALDQSWTCDGPAVDQRWGAAKAQSRERRSEIAKLTHWVPVKAS